MTMSTNEPQAIKLFGKTIVQSNNSNKFIDQSSTSTSSSSEVEETAPPKPGPAKVLPCPRCKSKETKFCYFNNYNVNQPRHFCKSCHRYWTAGGTLRSVPVGAGRRKNRIPHVAADGSKRSFDVDEEIN